MAQDNGVKGNASGVRCASCHPGGGMVQKDLNATWTYLQTDPGGYVAKHKDAYGNFQTGLQFEPITKAQNARWDKKRVEELAKKGTAELLRPVFCTMDINLQSGGSTVNEDFLIDSQLLAQAQGALASGSSISLDPKNYQAAIKDLKQVIKTSPAFPSAKDDTPDPFIFPEHSNLDEEYVRALIASKKVDADLVHQILFVDFTRPIYSPVRCSLAGLAEGISDPAKAKDELLKKLNGKTRNAAENELLAALQAAPRQLKEDVAGYIIACSARGKSDNPGYAQDVVKYASHLRQVTKLMKVKLKVEQDELGILDFDETVPFTELSSKAVKEMHFEKLSCKLVED
jgi:hypothetical protein